MDEVFSLRTETIVHVKRDLYGNRIIYYKRQYRDENSNVINAPPYRKTSLEDRVFGGAVNYGRVSLPLIQYTCSLSFILSLQNSSFLVVAKYVIEEQLQMSMRITVSVIAAY